MDNDARNFAIAVLAVLLSAIVVLHGRTNRGSELRLAQVQGMLEDWSEVGFQGRKPALRFRLAKESPDFRVDPSIYQRLMGGSVPLCFERGAPLAVTVRADELLSPKSSVVDPTIQIVWVRGINCAGRDLYDSSQVVVWERNNERWGFGLLAAAVLYLGYAAWRWTRAGTNSGRRR